MEFKEILKRRAYGYEVKEVLEEFAEDGEELKLQKKKVTTKFVAPDTLALKMLYDLESGEESGNRYSNLNVEELLEMKNNLINEINNLCDNGVGE